MAFKCSGNGYDIKECNNEPIWIIVGVSAQFGVPHSPFHCNDCKEYLEKNPVPKIMEYNRFDYIFVEIDNACESCFSFSNMRCLKFDTYLECLFPMENHCFHHYKIFGRKCESMDCMNKAEYKCIENEKRYCRNCKILMNVNGAGIEIDDYHFLSIEEAEKKLDKDIEDFTNGLTIAIWDLNKKHGNVLYRTGLGNSLVPLIKFMKGIKKDQEGN